MEVTSDKYPRLETLDVSTICHNSLNEDGKKKPSDREEVLIDKNISPCKDSILEKMSAGRNTEHTENRDTAFIKALVCSGAGEQFTIKNDDGYSSGIKSNGFMENSSLFFTNMDYRWLTVKNTVVILHQEYMAICNMNCLLSPYYCKNSRYSHVTNHAYFLVDNTNKEMCSGIISQIATCNYKINNLTRSHCPKSLNQRECSCRNISEECAHLIKRLLFVMRHLGIQCSTRNICILNDDNQRVIAKLKNSDFNDQSNSDKNARQIQIIKTLNVTCNDKNISFKAESHNCLFLNQDGTVPVYNEWHLVCWSKQRLIAVEDLELQARYLKSTGILKCTYLDGRNNEVIFPGTIKHKLVSAAAKTKELTIAYNKNTEEPLKLSNGDANGEQTVFDREKLEIIPNDKLVSTDIKNRDLLSAENKNQELISAESKILLSVDGQIEELISPNIDDHELPLFSTKSQEMIFTDTVFSRGEFQSHDVCRSDNDTRWGITETILQVQTNGTREEMRNNEHNQLLASVEDMKSEANIFIDYQRIIGTTYDGSKSNAGDVDRKEVCINHNGVAENRTCLAVALAETSDGTHNTNALNGLPVSIVDGDVLSTNSICCDCQQMANVCQFERFDSVGFAKDVSTSDISCGRREGDITRNCGFDQARNHIGDKKHSHVDLFVHSIISDTKGRSIIDNKVDATSNTVITLATHDGRTLLMEELLTDARNYIGKGTFNKQIITCVTDHIVPTMPPDNRDVKDDTKEFSTDRTTPDTNAITKQSDFRMTGQLLIESNSGWILRNIFSNNNKTRPTDINISGVCKGRRQMSNEKISIPGRGPVEMSNVNGCMKLSPTKDITSARNALVRSDTVHKVHFGCPLAEYIEYSPGAAASIDDGDDGDVSYVFDHVYGNSSSDEKSQNYWVDKEVDVQNKFKTRESRDQPSAKQNKSTGKLGVKQNRKTSSTPREDVSYLEKQQFVPVCLNANSDQCENDETPEEDEHVHVSQSKDRHISFNLSPNSHISEGHISARNMETETEIHQSGDDSELMVKQNINYNDSCFCKQESEKELTEQTYVTDIQHLKAVKRKRCQLIDVDVYRPRKALKVQIYNDGNAIVPTSASLPQSHTISAHYDSEAVDNEIPDDTSFYEQAEVKGRPDVCSIKSFPWKYTHSCSNINRSNDQGHNNITSASTKSRPLRLGLSRKQKVASLHPYFKYKQGH